MKRSVCLASLFLGVFASGAFAADVSVSGSVEDSIAASNNYFLTISPLGYTAKSSSNINLGFLAATPTTRYSLDSNYSYYKYFGPGAASQSLTWGTPIKSKFNAYYFTPLGKYNYGASWQRSDLATTQLLETGTVTGRGFVDNYKVNAGLNRNLSRVDTVSWGAQASNTSYTDPSQTPNFDYATNGAWVHRISPSTSWTNSINVDWFTSENSTRNQRLMWNVTTGIKLQLTKRLNVTGSFGNIFVNAWQQGSGTTLAPGALIPPGASHGWLANLAAAYNLSPATVAVLNAARVVSPTVLGQLQMTESVGLTMNHTINHKSSITFLTQFSHISSEGTVSDTFSASAKYEYRLARQWRSSLSYIYQQRNNTAGLAAASTVMLSLTHDFNLYGKPPAAAAKTVSDLAAEAQLRGAQALPTLNPQDLPDVNQPTPSDQNSQEPALNP